MNPPACFANAPSIPTSNRKSTEFALKSSINGHVTLPFLAAYQANLTRDSGIAQHITLHSIPHTLKA